MADERAGAWRMGGLQAARGSCSQGVNEELPLWIESAPLHDVALVAPQLVNVAGLDNNVGTMFGSRSMTPRSETCSTPRRPSRSGPRRVPPLSGSKISCKDAQELAAKARRSTLELGPARRYVKPSAHLHLKGSTQSKADAMMP